mgnify:CR=1 FL=1
MQRTAERNVDELSAAADAEHGLVRIDEFMQHFELVEIAHAVAGPARVVPFAPAPLKLKLTNTSRAEQRLDWPACLDLWLVAANGARVAFNSEPAGLSSGMG